MARPYGVIGAAAGVTHYLWMEKIWTRDTQFSELTNHIVGNGIYGSVFTFVVINPRYWWSGLFFGGCLGNKIFQKLEKKLLDSTKALLISKIIILLSKY